MPGQGNASEPAHVIYSLNEKGIVEPTILGRYGSLIGNMPKPEGDERTSAPGLSTQNRDRLLRAICDATGCTSPQTLLEASIADNICPAICTNCLHVYAMEPDQDRGWCTECCQNTVQSALVLAGVI